MPSAWDQYHVAAATSDEPVGSAVAPASDPWAQYHAGPPDAQNGASDPWSKFHYTPPPPSTTPAADQAATEVPPSYSATPVLDPLGVKQLGADAMAQAAATPRIVGGPQVLTPQEEIAAGRQAPQWAQNAAAGAMQVASGMVPRTASAVAQFLTPIASLPDEAKQIYGSANRLIAGQPLDQIVKEQYPESQTLLEAEKTPPYSQERFAAGFDVIANMLMAHGIASHPDFGVGKRASQPVETQSETPVQQQQTASTQPGGLSETSPSSNVQATAEAAATQGIKVPENFAGVTGPETVDQGGEVNASGQSSTTGVSSGEVRGAVDETPPLRQQGETAPVQGDVGSSQAQQAAETPVGISQARTEAELGAGSVVPGVGSEMGSGLDYGRKYINAGGDPRLPIRRATSSGLVGKNEVGIVHAELERLRGERDVAAAAAEANPGDPVAQQNLANADNAQRAWRQELQPVLTKASDALREAYTESTHPDVGTYAGLSNLMDEHFNGQHDITPQDRTTLQRVAKTVTDARTKTAKSVDSAVEATSRKVKNVMSPDQLKADLAGVLKDEFSNCIL